MYTYMVHTRREKERDPHTHTHTYMYTSIYISVLLFCTHPAWNALKTMHQYVYINAICVKHYFLYDVRCVWNKDDVKITVEDAVMDRDVNEWYFHRDGHTSSACRWVFYVPFQKKEKKKKCCSCMCVRVSSIGLIALSLCT